VFRLSKSTDYGIRILAHLARDGRATTHNAREVAQDLKLPLPMVSKVMKALARAGVLESHRGAKGGFNLARRPDALTVAAMIDALEGPVALTECQIGPALCVHEGSCNVQEPWGVINTAVKNTLATITLSDLINPGFPKATSVLSMIDPPLADPTFTDPIRPAETPPETRPEGSD
jgi:FeS assembly SUF system regulator